MIKVEKLTKKYGQITAVEDLSFSVEQGQIYGFLGPNGAGKSTTMNMMTGYIAPTSGRVFIGGHDIAEDGMAARRCIGYLPEIPPLYPEMTVEEYLSFASGLKKIPAKEQKEQIQKALSMTGTMEVEKRLIRNLSKGFRQRVGLAQAVLGEPDVLILDEPMVGLDPKQIIEIRELIRTLGERHTIILSSHILSEISAICDHILIISHGKLVASDTPQKLTGMMKDSGTLSLTVRGEEEQVLPLLAGIEQIRDLKVAGRGEEGELSLEITAENGADVREEVFFALAGAKKPILEMSRGRASLEEIFLELTEGEQSADSNEKEGKSPMGRLFKNKKRAKEQEGGDEQ